MKKIVRKMRDQAFSFWWKWIYFGSPATAEEIRANAELRSFGASQQRNAKVSHALIPGPEFLYTSQIMQSTFFTTCTKTSERLAYWEVCSLTYAPRFRCPRAEIHKSRIELAGQAAINVPQDVNDNTSVFWC